MTKSQTPTKPIKQTKPKKLQKTCKTIQLNYKIHSEHAFQTKIISQLSTSCSNLDTECINFEQKTSQTQSHFELESSKTDLLEQYCNQKQNKALKLKKKCKQIQEYTKKWSEDETLKFYKGLELFGTDFSMISNIFTNRSRKMCKNKFRKEEKQNLLEIELRLARNRNQRMNKIIQKLNKIKAKLNIKNSKNYTENINILQQARRKRLLSFTSVDTQDINIVEIVESKLDGSSLF